MQTRRWTVVVTDQERLGKLRLTVMGSAGTSRSYGWQALADGTAEIAVGGIVAGGFGVEAVKGLIEGKAAGLWWFFSGVILGLALVVLGLILRERARKSVRVGVVVAARDPRIGAARARQVEQQAEAFSRDLCAVTMKIETSLLANDSQNLNVINELAEETLSAIAMAERLTPDAYRINLIPVMPPHVAFWFGARMGYVHAREISVHAIRQARGTPAYFSAVSLRIARQNSSPLAVDRLEFIDGGSQAMAALAVDLEGRRDQFIDHVRTACREQGIGYLLTASAGSSMLGDSKRNYADAVEQVCKSWLEAPLPAIARTGHHYVFFSGPEAVAVALGARLASVEYSRWTVFAFDEETYSYKPFLAAPEVKAVPGGKAERGPVTDLKSASVKSRKPANLQMAKLPDSWKTGSKLAVGDKVKHEKYGIGEVVAADGAGPRATVTVDFGNAGVVRLMLIAGIPMTKIDP